MWKKIVSLVMSFVLAASVVSSVAAGGEEDYYGGSSDSSTEESLFVLLSAYSDSYGVYDGNENVSRGLSLYNKTLTAYELKSMMEFQVSISASLEISSVVFTSSNTSVANIETRLAEDGSHIFTLWVIGYGTASISMSVNKSNSVEVFRIIVGDSDGKDTETYDYERIVQEAKKIIPSIVIVDETETIVSGKSSTFSVGENKSYYIAISTVGQNSNAIGFSFYDRAGYYFFLDTERIKWTVSGSHVASNASGYGISLTGKSAGEDTLKAEIPVSVWYYPELEKGISALIDQNMDYEDGYESDMGDIWDIGSVSAETKIQVTEKKASKTVPYNPFTGIDLAKVENPFTDVSPSDWYYEAVMYLYAAGILDGVDFDGQYVYYKSGGGLSIGDAPNSSFTIRKQSEFGGQEAVTAEVMRYLNGNIASPSRSDGVRFNQSNPQNRQNSVVQLYNSHKSIGYTIGSYTENPFTDVKSNVNSYQPILWASNNGIIKGYGNGKFGPYDHITREQFCAILVRHAKVAGISFQTKYPAKNFTDNNKISSWAKSDVVTCQRAGIIQGYPDGSFRPQGDITTAEMCVMIMNYLYLIS